MNDVNDVERIDFDEVFKRLKLATNASTQMELAAVLEIRQSSISDAKRRNSVPAEWFMKLFETMGLNPDWLKKGVGPRYLRTEQGYMPFNGDDETEGQLYESVAQYGEPDAKNIVVSVCSAQDAYNADTPAQSIGKLNIPMSFAIPGLYVIRYESASMEPHIRRGAYVGLDTMQARVISGELYGINLPYEGVVIRRIYLDSSGKTLTLYAEDKNYPHITMPLNDGEVFKAIVGKVNWVLQKM